MLFRTSSLFGSSIIMISTVGHFDSIEWQSGSSPGNGRRHQSLSPSDRAMLNIPLMPRAGIPRSSSFDVLLSPRSKKDRMEAEYKILQDMAKTEVRSTSVCAMSRSYTLRVGYYPAPLVCTTIPMSPQFSYQDGSLRGIFITQVRTVRCTDTQASFPHRTIMKGPIIKTIEKLSLS